MNAASPPNPYANGQRGSALAVLLICVGLAIIVIVLSFRVHSLSGRVARAAEPQAPAATAKADIAPAQAELDKAKGAVAQLQAQLDKAAGREAGLRSQLVKAAAQAADLQAQLDGAKTRLSGLQSQAESATSRAAELEAQLAGAASRATQLQTQLDQETARGSDLQARLKKAEADIAGLQPLVRRGRRLPITTSVERDQGSLLGWAGGRGSLTLHIVNPFPESLPVAITVNGPDTNRSVTGSIAGASTLNIEKLAGGQTVVISSEGYDPVTVAIK